MIRPSFALFAERRELISEIFRSDIIGKLHFAVITPFTCLLKNAVCVVLMMPARVPEEKRVAAIWMSLSGTSQRNIARVLELHLATVNRIICAFRDEGHICDAARNCVRKTTAEEDAALVQVAEANPFVTAGQIRDVVGLDVSKELVRKVDVLPESRFFRTQQEQKDWLLPRLIFTGQ